MTAQLRYSVESENITQEKLSSLLPRDRQIIEMRLGMGEFKRQHTLKEIGLHFQVTANNIRQRECRSLRKMRHPRFRKTEEIPLFEREIESVIKNRRLANCLVSHSIFSLNDLKKKGFTSPGAVEVFLLKIPNFGRKSWREFTDFLKANNLSYSDFIKTREEMQQDKISSIQNQVNEIKSVLNGHHNHMKRIEDYFIGHKRVASEKYREEIEVFKEELRGISGEIQRNINRKILEFNEYMAVERYRLDQLLANIKLTG